MRILCTAVAAASLLVGGAAFAQAGGLTIAPGLDGSVTCSGSAVVDGVTYTCDDVQALATARANGGETGPTLPAEVESAVSLLAASIKAGVQ